MSDLRPRCFFLQRFLDVVQTEQSEDPTVKTRLSYRAGFIDDCLGGVHGVISEVFLPFPRRDPSRYDYRNRSGLWTLCSRSAALCGTGRGP